MSFYSPEQWRQLCAGSPSLLIYRGIAIGKSRQFADAQRGMVVPWGGDAGRTGLDADYDYIRGILPEPLTVANSAGFTAWTPLIQVARSHAQDGGIILKIPLIQVLERVIMRPIFRFGNCGGECELFVRGTLSNLESIPPQQWLGETLIPGLNSSAKKL
jgi:hypothetical protein